MVFLSGPPNARRGSVVAVQLPEEQEAREREQRQREAERVGMADFIDPSFPEASSWQEVAPQQRLPPAPRKGTASQINLVHAAPWAPAGAQVEVDWGASEFWEQAGAAAAALGVQGELLVLRLLSTGFFWCCCCSASWAAHLLQLSLHPRPVLRHLIPRSALMMFDKPVLRCHTAPVQWMSVRCVMASWGWS